MLSEPPTQSPITPLRGLHNGPAIHAAVAALQGTLVVPVAAATKRPLITTGRGHREGALRDSDAVLNLHAQLFRNYGVMPDWAIVTGYGLAVLDVDRGGESAVADLAANDPEITAWLSATGQVRTGSGGRHYYGTHPVGVKVRSRTGVLAPRVDVRGDGGIAVVPDSRHRSGGHYVLDTDLNLNTAAAAEARDARTMFISLRERSDDLAPEQVPVYALPIPAALLGLIVDDDAKEVETPTSPTPPEVSNATARRRFAGLVRMVENVERGQSNSALNNAAGVAAALRIDRAEAEQQLVGAVMRRPHSEAPEVRRREARNTFASGWEWGTANPCEALKKRADTRTISTTPTTPTAPAQTVAPPCPATHEERRARGRADNDLQDTMTTDDNAERLDDLGEAFFEARPALRNLRDFARARHVAPWALLGVVLARVAAAVPPSVVLPPTRGSVASLNFFVAICGLSGSGKSAVMEAARDFLIVEGGVKPLETAPGSGEGLIAAYVHTKLENGKVRRTQTRRSVLLEVDEVQALGSLTSRTASTLMPFLKSAWSGKMLATQNADPTRQRRVDPHEYRLAIVAGVQPANASILLDDAAGGFPQRWLWLPTFDPGMLPRGQSFTEPRPLRWRVPIENAKIHTDGTTTLPGRTVMQLPNEAVEAILDAAEAQNRPIGAAPATGTDALDGHALLSRTKVAALLALLDGRAVEVTSDDRLLAGIVMDMSDRTRSEIIGVNAQSARVDADKKAERQGRTAAIAEDAQAEAKTVRILRNLERYLADGEEWPRAALRRKLRSSDRDAFDHALDRLVGSGLVIAEDRETANGPATYLRATGGTK